MNKQLINKYKPEFDHWLNEGSVLLGIRDLVKSTIKWYPSVTDPFEEESTSGELLIIINDDYKLYRKALAEGKIVQYLGQYSNMWHEVQEPDFNLHPNCYRIKPDKPNFKVGDFVRYIPSTPTRALEINNINENKYYFTDSDMVCVEHELEPWTPIKGEWCWFFNDDRIPTISQFVEMNNDITRKYFAVYPNRPKALGSWYKKCEPFLNSRPSYLKDK